MARRPSTQLYAPPRSIRVPDKVWNAAKRRAKSEGTTPSYVVNMFLEGYANGMLNLPRVQVVYPAAEQADAS